jgi:O-antigen/teichoic acid export membrane protein
MIARERRAKRLRWAVASSLLSKAAGSVAQLLTLPLIAHALGAPRYGAFLALTASIAWTSLLSFGLRPALTRLLAEARASKCIDSERRLISAAVGFTGVIAILLLLATLTVTGFVDPHVLIGAGAEIPDRELSLGLFAVMGVVAVHFCAATSTAIRAGFQESYVSNLLSFLANIVIIAGAALANARGAAIWGWVLVLYTPFAAFFLADLIVLVARRPKISLPKASGRAEWRHPHVRALLTVSGATSGVQIHYFLTAFGTVILVSHLYSTAATVAFGSMMRGTILAAGLISIFVLPSVPALTDAATRNDIAWVRTCSMRLLGMTLVGSSMIAIAVALFGAQLVHLWLGTSVQPSPLMCVSFAGYFLFSMLNFTGFNVALALGAVKGVGWQFIAEAALVYLAILVFRSTAWLPGAEGVAVALAVGAISINSWSLPLRIHHRIHELDGRRTQNLAVGNVQQRS